MGVGHLEEGNWFSSSADPIKVFRRCAASRGRWDPRQVTAYLVCAHSAGRWGGGLSEPLAASLAQTRRNTRAVAHPGCLFSRPAVLSAVVLCLLCSTASMMETTLCSRAVAGLEADSLLGERGPYRLVNLKPTRQFRCRRTGVTICQFLPSFIRHGAPLECQEVY